MQKPLKKRALLHKSKGGQMQAQSVRKQASPCPKAGNHAFVDTNGAVESQPGYSSLQNITEDR